MPLASRALVAAFASLLLVSSACARVRAVEEGKLMVKRTQRHFDTYDAQKMVEQLEPLKRQMGEWNAKVPLGAPIYVALRAFQEASQLLLDTARGDIRKPIGTPTVAPHGHSSTDFTKPSDWP